VNQLLADVVVLAHLGFVVFVMIGGLAVLRWPRLAWVHVPAAAWGALIEFAGWICPLTPLENALRQAGGGSAYAGGFIDHYVAGVLYPVGLTRGLQIALGSFAVLVNVLIYWRAVRRWRGAHRAGARS
jgi:hypothetical protein